MYLTFLELIDEHPSVSFLGFSLPHLKHPQRGGTTPDVYF
jgi:hypothetical protein